MEAAGLPHGRYRIHPCTSHTQVKRHTPPFALKFWCEVTLKKSNVTCPCIDAPLVLVLNCRTFERVYVSYTRVDAVTWDRSSGPSGSRGLLWENGCWRQALDIPMNAKCHGMLKTLVHSVCISATETWTKCWSFCSNN